MKAVQFGAGNIGRGLFGRLLNLAGWEIVFVDAIPVVVAELNRRGGYEVHILGRQCSIVEVRGVRALHVSDVARVSDEVSTADLLGVSVGVKNLPAVAPLIAEALRARAERNPEPIDIVVLENLLGAAATLRRLVLGAAGPAHRFVEEQVGFVATVVGMMAPVIPEAKRREDPLYLAAESFAELPVDSRAFRAPRPAARGLIFVDNMDAYEERKLFVHNCGHSTCAFLGRRKGYEFIYQAIEDLDIYPVVRGAMWESAECLIRRHGFRYFDLSAHIEDLLRRFDNPALGDQVTRVARDPLRKLAPNDRLVAPARLAISYGLAPVNIVKGIAAALHYANPEDESAVALQSMVRERGFESVLREVCRIEPGEELFGMIMAELAKG